METVEALVSRMKEVRSLEQEASDLFCSMNLPPIYCKYDYPEFYEVDRLNLEARYLQREIVERLRGHDHGEVVGYLLRTIREKTAVGEAGRFDCYALLGELCDESDAQVIAELRRAAYGRRFIRPQCDPSKVGRRYAAAALDRLHENNSDKVYWRYFNEISAVAENRDAYGPDERILLLEGLKRRMKKDRAVGGLLQRLAEQADFEINLIRLFRV
jgi:hypothetical protein